MNIIILRRIRRLCNGTTWRRRPFAGRFRLGLGLCWSSGGPPKFKRSASGISASSPKSEKHKLRINTSLWPRHFLNLSPFICAIQYFEQSQIILWTFYNWSVAFQIRAIFTIFPERRKRLPKIDFSIEEKNKNCLPRYITAELKRENSDLKMLLGSKKMEIEVIFFRLRHTFSQMWPMIKNPIFNYRKKKYF